VQRRAGVTFPASAMCSTPYSTVWRWFCLIIWYQRLPICCISPSPHGSTP